MKRVPGKRSASEQRIKKIFVSQCWSYLHDNFYKFNEDNKVRIAMEIVKRNIPQQIEGSFRVTEMPMIRLDDGTSFIPEIGEDIQSQPDEDEEDADS